MQQSTLGIQISNRF